MIKQIGLTGVRNARELGGYTVGDRMVKHGVLFRTGDLSKADPSAQTKLSEEYHVGTIIDFRMTAECKAAPDHSVNGAQYVHLPAFELEDYLTETDANEAVITPDMDRLEIFEMVFRSGKICYNNYVDLLLGERGRAAYSGFLRLLLESRPDSAVLWHCTDGKDRTGCAAMLLLSALGADRETIMEDYLLTNLYRADAAENVRKIIAEHPMPDEKADALMFMSGCVAEKYMTTALDALDQRYGSVLGYIREELSVSDAQIEILREKYLCQREL